MTTFLHSWAIFITLIKRDLYVLRNRLADKCIDAAIQLFIQTLSFGFLFPLLGMPQELIPPMYIGMSFVLYLFFNGYAFSTTMMRLIANNKTTLLTYELTLPLKKTWLLLRYIVSYIIETLIISVPLMTLGIIILSDLFKDAQGSWLLFYSTYLLCLVFSGIFFMFLPFHYDPGYFWNNIWPRRLSWLLNFGALFYTWKGAYALNSILALAILINPFTYLAEGLRSILLGTDGYLSASLCIAMISGYSGLFWIMLQKAVQKRLDTL